VATASGHGPAGGRGEPEHPGPYSIILVWHFFFECTGTVTAAAVTGAAEVARTGTTTKAPAPECRATVLVLLPLAVPVAHTLADRRCAQCRTPPGRCA
jgi:hypothetical protein